MRRKAVSLVIIAALSTQYAVMLVSIERLTWPIVNYPMYSWSHRLGDVIDRYAIRGTLSDGATVSVTAESLRLNFWEYLWGPVEALKKNKRDEIQRFLDLDQRLNGRTFVAVFLENRPVLFTKHGPVEGRVQTTRALALSMGKLQ